MRCRIYPLGALKDYKYVVVCAWYQGCWLLSRHKKRDTWETQGGHIEPGETPLDAARRELYEESGVSDAEIIPVCDYYGYDDKGHSNGRVFLAKVRSLGMLPESEMARVQAFEELPENLTYPNVTPVLMREALKYDKE
ncbi:MAG: NUDIX domain-containing protein [Clostridia bacterium]|nr:NUDIX domain-containing protein [Clostridia bacterium]